MQHIHRIEKEKIEKLVNETIDKWLKEERAKGGKPFWMNEQLSFRHDWDSYNNPLSYKREHNLSEGLIKTYPAKKACDYVRDYYNLEEWQCYIKVEENVECIVVVIPLTSENADEIRKSMDMMGYHLSRTGRRIGRTVWRTMQFEPKFQPSDTDEIIETCKALYHVSPLYNKEKILKNGLCPKSRNLMFNYPSRIYLFTDKIPKGTIEGYAMSIWETERERHKTDRTEGNYVLFEIPTNELPYGVELYRDPNLHDAVWTSSNIPPDIIKPIKEFHFNKT